MYRELEGIVIKGEHLHGMSQLTTFSILHGGAQYQQYHNNTNIHLETYLLKE